MKNNQIKLTREGFEKLKAELTYLKTQKRAEIAEKLKEATSSEDILINSEYDYVKNEKEEGFVFFETDDENLDYVIDDANAD